MAVAGEGLDLAKTENRTVMLVGSYDPKDGLTKAEWSTWRARWSPSPSSRPSAAASPTRAATSPRPRRRRSAQEVNKHAAQNPPPSAGEVGERMSRERGSAT